MEAMEINASDNEEIYDSEPTDEKATRKKKPGIIYLSTLPPYMNVTKTRELFGEFGEIDRIFLQPATKEEDVKKKKKNKKPSLHFSEGWVEFKSKRIAKAVALNLNNQLIGGKKKSKFYDYTWNIKYLPRFKWAHLSERLAYERAVRSQRLRAEISQAKRETNFFSANIEKSRKFKQNSNSDVSNEYIQRSTESDILSTKENSKDDRKEFLKSLFAGS